MSKLKGKSKEIRGAAYSKWNKRPALTKNDYPFAKGVTVVGEGEGEMLYSLKNRKLKVIKRKGLEDIEGYKTQKTKGAMEAQEAEENYG
jgi:hypothetical protein